jgi:hypothetical protein
MIDLYLRFDTPTAMLDALRPLGMTYTDDDGVERLATGGHDYAAWEVGEIPGREGWHLNLRVIRDGLDLAPLAPHLVEPRNPVVVWA